MLLSFVFHEISSLSGHRSSSLPPMEHLWRRLVEHGLGFGTWLLQNGADASIPEGFLLQD